MPDLTGASQDDYETQSAPGAPLAADLGAAPPPAFDSPAAREFALARLEAKVLGADGASGAARPFDGLVRLRQRGMRLLLARRDSEPSDADTLKTPTLLRRQQTTGAGVDEQDPVLEASVRNRVAALAALAGAVYSVAVPLDLSLHAAFHTSGLTSPARLKNVLMALLSWWVFRAARRAQVSLDSVVRLAFFMVFAVGIHQTLESLHFFQSSALPYTAGLPPGVEKPSLIDGLTWTCVFMVLFPPFVPSSPTKHFLLALSLALPLLTLPLAWSWVSGIEYFAIISPGSFASVPLSVALCLFMSVAIHRIDRVLREERRRSRELGSYELVDKLGHGGMGEVWLARHKMLARPAALKVIKADRVDASPERAASALRRFEREARATARLRSTHTVELYDFGRTDAGDFYYVMELLDGMDLEALVARHGPQPAWRVVRILRQICLSLQEAHELGLIHRDIKPANIFLCRQGSELDIVKVLDFGLVTEVARGADGEAATLTHENDVVGTPAFMAPEIIVDPDNADHRADLYALGCVAYTLLSGRLLFEEKTVVGLLSAHVHKPLPKPLFDASGASVPAALEDLVVDLLAKGPAERPPTALVVRQRLEQILVGDAWDDARLKEWWDAAGPSLPVG